MNSFGIFISTLVAFVSSPSYMRFTQQDNPEKRKWVDELDLKRRQEIEKEFYDAYNKSGPLKWKHGIYFCMDGNRNFWDHYAEGHVTKARIRLTTFNFTPIPAELLTCRYFRDQYGSCEYCPAERLRQDQPRTNTIGISFWAALPESYEHGYDSLMENQIQIYEIRALNSSYKNHWGYLAIHGLSYL